jgi:hypothetical protein
MSDVVWIMSTSSAIQSAVLVTMLSMAAMHYFPWRLVLGRMLPRPAAYVLGVLGMALPLTWLFQYWQATPVMFRWEYLLALWLVIGAGGVSVLVCYAADHVMGRMVMARELEELLRQREARHGTTAETGSQAERCR